MNNQTIDGVPREHSEAVSTIIRDICEHEPDDNPDSAHISIKALELILLQNLEGLIKPAARPHGEPVEDCETFEYQLDMLGSIDRCNVSCGSYGDKYHQWDDAGPYVEYEDHVKHIELYKREIERLSKLYAEQPAQVVANWSDWSTVSIRVSGRVRTYVETGKHEQPAPVAVVLPTQHDFEQFLIQRDGAVWVSVLGDRRDYNEPINRDYAMWCACLDELKRLNPSL